MGTAGWLAASVTHGSLARDFDQDRLKKW